MTGPAASQRKRRTPTRRSTANTPGFAARQTALSILEGVTVHGHSLDESLDKAMAGSGLEPRDRGLARMIAATALRRGGQIERVIAKCLARPLTGKAALVRDIVALGAAQILFMDVSDHAAVDLSVELARSNRRRVPYANLVNGVLRRVGRERDALLATTSPLDNIPHILRERWADCYGADIVMSVAHAMSTEPAVDLAFRSIDDDARWADAIGGTRVADGTIRLKGAGDITALPGFADGAWWVQDAAAQVPTRLLGDVAGKRVADLCAAPGGKTAQLASAGADVLAVDLSAERMARLRANMARLRLAPTVIVADAVSWHPEGLVDSVLLDAPCSATGTLRRHPDFAYLRSDFDLTALIVLQAALLDNAVKMLRPGGTLVYCTCSLEPEEGEDQIAALLERHPTLAIAPVASDEVPGFGDAIQPGGTLRILPTALPHDDPRLAGATGFFIARLTKPV